MDPNQTIGSMQSRINDIDVAGSDPRTEKLPAGPTCADGTVEMTQTHKSLQSEPQTRIERQATIELQNQIGPHD
ncbi:hypothetical protein F2Q69_00022740 [Brassica cretica]|uniref:Uncharacterized protein n=1 Tax=Brassica cretica TaxID=69181 RepID=A0A8S9Q2M4_BRACR|nr:hypothetical protein F2Q69_00022740 [Brassica cretica]